MEQDGGQGWLEGRWRTPRTAQGYSPRWPQPSALISVAVPAEVPAVTAHHHGAALWRSRRSMDDSNALDEIGQVVALALKEPGGPPQPRLGKALVLVRGAVGTVSTGWGSPPWRLLAGPAAAPRSRRESAARRGPHQ